MLRTPRDRYSRGSCADRVDDVFTHEFDEQRLLPHHSLIYPLKEDQLMRVAHLSFALFFGLTSTIVASAGTIDAALPLDTATSHLALAVTFDGKQIISAS